MIIPSWYPNILDFSRRPLDLKFNLSPQSQVLIFELSPLLSDTADLNTEMELIAEIGIITDPIEFAEDKKRGEPILPSVQVFILT